MKFISLARLFGCSTAMLLIAVSPLHAGPNEARKLFEEGRTKLQFGDPAKAELLYAQAMQEAPNDAGYAMAMADLYITQRRFESAATLINDALKTRDSDYRVWRTLGSYQQAQGDQSAAIASFEKAFALGGQDDPYVLTTLQQHYEKTGNTTRRKQMESHLQPVKPDVKNKEYRGPVRNN